jgi:hypothetical protein
MNPVETQVHEIKQKFGRLVRAHLGNDNERGTARYKFEVEFAHSLNEIDHAPAYIVQKYVDKLQGVLNDVVKHIKVLEGA